MHIIGVLKTEIMGTTVTEVNTAMKFTGDGK
jgi:hypothetical protein